MKLVEYVEGRGRQSELAREIKVQPQLIWQWARGVRPVPLARCIPIERATAGQVRCEDLRPDVDWAYLRGVAPAGSAGDAGPVINPQESRHAA